MATNGEVEITWADGTHKFNIAKIKSALELQEKCNNTGVAAIFRRLLNETWEINDIRETLRIGLIGAGMMPDKALTLINRYCDDRPWAENLQAAQVILMAAMFGVPGDEVGKKVETERAKEGQPSEKMADTSVPSSMGSAPPSDLPRATPTK